LSIELEIHDAYGILGYYSRLHENIASWKLGGTNNSAGAAGCPSLVTLGFILDRDCNRFEELETSNFPDDHFEVEVAVKLTEDLLKATSAQQMSSIELQLFLALECPRFDASLGKLNSISGEILKNCSSGTIHISHDTIALLRLTRELIGNNKIEFIGLKKSLSEIVWDFLEMSRIYDLNVKPGQFLSTGGLTPLILKKTLIKICRDKSGHYIFDLV
jgi:hypothetical protein